MEHLVIGTVLLFFKLIFWVGVAVFFTLRDKPAPLPAPSGVKLESLETHPAACQVCRTDPAAQTVSCPKCRGIHHRECWDYSGGCSTYGCREKRL